jgi:hypothetical protein
MKTLIIRRIATGADGTFGCIIYKNKPFALTLEREWLGNSTGISCIPAGNYKCKRVDSPKFGNTFEVTNVPGRTHILFHKGNLDSDSHGCILVGEQFGDIKGSAGILSSKQGYNELMSIMKDDIGFRLIIVDDWKTQLN